MKRLFFAAVSLLTCVSVLAQNSEVKFVERPDTESKSSNYVGNRAPLAPAAAIKLPLGSIHAEGWLGEVLSASATAWRDTSARSVRGSRRRATRGSRPKVTQAGRRFLTGFADTPIWRI